jgi:hypothetical protein
VNFKTKAVGNFKLKEADFENLAVPPLTLPIELYAHRTVYFKNRLYIFGGGATSGILLRALYTLNHMYMLKLEGW